MNVKLVVYKVTTGLSVVKNFLFNLNACHPELCVGLQINFVATL